LTPGSAKRILIAPLDWGLGHTTRCIPFIRQLLELKHEVYFAGNDSQQTFVAKLFPGITLLTLGGYGVRYGHRWLMPSLLRQIPRLASRIRSEHKWLLDTVLHEKIDAIISDNRYGLWHPGIPSVILTHQAEIRTGFGGWADGILRLMHYRMLRRFSACWIVDIVGPENLGGDLSHPSVLPQNARYIGWISQLNPPDAEQRRQHLLILLSGPEPQRSMLSDMLWDQACGLEAPVVFVEGKASAIRTHVPGHITHITRTGGAQLQSLLEGATIVVCRSGYSTLMDLILLRKKAILIPTPGQTEQEYLARRLRKQGIFYAAPQQGFSLEAALAKAEQFPYLIPDANGNHEAYRKVVTEWVSTF